ncbi:U-box domain-containing protein 51-like [Andrographis paniculata]|uniref:U-box domain-containing protein 51-like n=1 Tax=Andrographis paniculata TaxID=175694 RepID=UPI0021E87A1E|nr:U-box domain-containing protein 51-like [Andrographis paniculata]
MVEEITRILLLNSPGSPMSRASRNSRAQYESQGPGQISDSSVDVAGDRRLKEFFLPFRIFCLRNDIQCHNVVLDDTDVSRAVTDFVKRTVIDILVVGAGAKASFFRFKDKDIPGSLLKGVPDYCTVYVINKGKITSTRAATQL